MTSDGLTSTLSVLIVLSAIPVVLMLGTAFLKTFISLTILKAAFGDVKLPPAILVFPLAVLLSAVAMRPLISEISATLRAHGPASKATEIFSADGANSLLSSCRIAAVPLSKFLLKHAHAEDVVLMKRLNKSEGELRPGLGSLWVALPAFVLSELNEAFLFGFLLLFPFLIIDLLVANVLTAVGTAGLNPLWVSLPLKLLFFIGVNGWALITRGLVMGYVQ